MSIPACSLPLSHTHINVPGFHFWKFIQTPAWKNLVEHCDSLDTILAVHINRVQDLLRLKKEHLALDSDLSLMEKLLLTNGIMPEDALTILLDMLLIGVNATSHSVSFLLYHLARYPRTQRLLYQEISNAPEVESYEDLTKLPYLQV